MNNLSHFTFSLCFLFGIIPLADGARADQDSKIIVVEDDDGGTSSVKVMVNENDPEVTSVFVYSDGTVRIYQENTGNRIDIRLKNSME